MCNGERSFSEALLTLYGAPFCLPPQDPLAVDLVLLVAAYDSERDHFLLGAGKCDQQLTEGVFPDQRPWPGSGVLVNGGVVP